MMKTYIFCAIFVIANSTMPLISVAQKNTATPQQEKEIQTLISQYSSARETRDTILLRKILTPEIDQLVSTGEWRNGVQESVTGMLRSSASTPGTRTLQVDKIRMLDSHTAIVDCKYDIQSGGGTARRMWSTFIVIKERNKWLISAIRNMLPGAP
jgi:uncharacterized protein (TIGR02246 family)